MSNKMIKEQGSVLDCVSQLLDGCTAESHDQFRDTIGHLEKTLEILLALDGSKINVKINTVFGKTNILSILAISS